MGSFNILLFYFLQNYSFPNAAAPIIMKEIIIVWFMLVLYHSKDRKKIFGGQLFIFFLPTQFLKLLYEFDLNQKKLIKFK